MKTITTAIILATTLSFSLFANASQTGGNGFENAQKTHSYEKFVQSQNDSGKVSNNEFKFIERNDK